MSWTDKTAIETIKRLRDQFKVNTFIETGTFKGINSFVQAKNFKYVITCEKIVEYCDQARKKLKCRGNVMIRLMDSPEFLGDFATRYRMEKMDDNIIFYLDAHFYDAQAKEKFIVREELKALEGFRNCIVIIHDFDNGMGHIDYDGETINLEMVGGLLHGINPHFKFYTNIPEKTEILTRENLKDMGLENDRDAIDNIRYAWSEKRLTKRGILYSIPKEINGDQFNLKRIDVHTEQLKGGEK